MLYLRSRSVYKIIEMSIKFIHVLILSIHMYHWFQMLSTTIYISVQ